MAAVRFLVSGLILLAASRRTRPRPTWLHWRNAAVVGAFFFLGNHGLMNNAARFIPSSLACLIVSTEVPVIAVLSSLLLPNRPLTARSLFGATLGLLGVLCLFVGKSGDEGASWVPSDDHGESSGGDCALHAVEAVAVFRDEKDREHAAGI